MGVALGVMEAGASGMGTVWMGETGVSVGGGEGIHVGVKDRKGEKPGRFVPFLPPAGIDVSVAVKVGVAVGGTTIASAASIWIRPAPEYISHPAGPISSAAASMIPRAESAPEI